jgi:hypothetical protein
MIERRQQLDDALGSLALEGLQPSAPTRELLERWAAGDATDDDLRDAERRVLAGEPLEDTGPGTPRAA